MIHDIWILLSQVSNSHWVEAIVVLKLKSITHLDSLNGITRILLKTILNYVKSQLVCYFTSVLDEEDWYIIAPTNLNIQKNSFDREVYACNNLDSKSVRN